MIPAGLAPQLTGMQAHKVLPAGHTIGTTFEHDGTTYYVTQAELDRIYNLPTAEEITNIVAAFNRAMHHGTAAPPATTRMRN